MKHLLALLAFVFMLGTALCDVTIVRPLPKTRGVYVDGYGGPGYYRGDWDDNGYDDDYGRRGLRFLPPFFDGYDDGFIRGYGGNIRRRYVRRYVQRVGRY